MRQSQKIILTRRFIPDDDIIFSLSLLSTNVGNETFSTVVILSVHISFMIHKLMIVLISFV